MQDWIIMQILNVKRRDSNYDILVQILIEDNGRGLDEILIVFFQHSAEIVIRNKTDNYEINF
jgi:hypothetical protein